MNKMMTNEEALRAGWRIAEDPAHDPVWRHRIEKLIRRIEAASDTGDEDPEVVGTLAALLVDPLRPPSIVAAVLLELGVT
jgi:hypothetical protein